MDAELRGRTTRLDFLLKDEEIVVETKFARQSLAAKKLGEELMVDIARNGAHPTCKTLICFVYDPARHIQTRLESRATSKS